MTPIMVAVAGGSGSGKSTFALRLQRYFPGQTVILRQDDYYLPQNHLSLAERERINYDSPEALDNTLLREHLLTLKSGGEIDCPVYDYARHTRSGEVRHVCSAPVIFVDGMLVLADEGLRSLFDLRVFVAVPEQERLSRRIARDVRERGRSEAGVREQFERTVIPMHAKHVEPSARYADITVTGGGENETAAFAVAERIKELQEKL